MSYSNNNKNILKINTKEGFLKEVPPNWLEMFVWQTIRDYVIEVMEKTYDDKLIPCAGKNINLQNIYNYDYKINIENQELMSIIKAVEISTKDGNNVKIWKIVEPKSEKAKNIIKRTHDKFDELLVNNSVNNPSIAEEPIITDDNPFFDEFYKEMKKRKKDKPEKEDEEDEEEME